MKSEILDQLPDVSDVLIHVDVEEPMMNSTSGIETSHVEKQMRPRWHIEKDVRKALSRIPEVTAMTHLDAHWVSTQFGYGTLVKVTITMDHDISLRQSHDFARRARKYVGRVIDWSLTENIEFNLPHPRQIEKSVSYIAEADLHLDLLDTDIWTTTTDDEIHDDDDDDGPGGYRWKKNE